MIYIFLYYIFFCFLSFEVTFNHGLQAKNRYVVGMNVYSFVSRQNRFEMLIATFRLQYCQSSSGDEVDCLRVAIYAHWFDLIGVFRSLLFRLADDVPSRVRFIVERLLCFLIEEDLRYIEHELLLLCFLNLLCSGRSLCCHRSPQALRFLTL